MCRRAVEQITASRPDAERDAGQIELVRLDRHQRAPVDVSPKHHFLKGRSSLVLFEQTEQLPFVSSQDAGQTAQGGFRFFRVFGNEKKIEGGTAIDQELPLAIEYHPSG